MRSYLRQFQNDIQKVDNRYVFPQVTVNDGIIDGTLAYAGNTDIQTQITATVAATTASQAAADANTVKLNTLLDSGAALDAISELKAAWESDDGVLQATIATAATDRTAIRSEMASMSPTYIHVDSSFSGSYTETGSRTAPYRTLSAAITAKLADGQTDTVVFQLAPGSYVGTISRDKTSVEQSFEIRGSGLANCFIKGSASWDATISSVLYFRDFISIHISGVSVSNGAYGIYVRDTPVVVVEDCQFANLGSNGVNHGFERTQAQMATDWATRGQAGSNRSDGGVMRIRQSARVDVRNCQSINTLRGFRLQDCNSGRITGCTVRHSLESSFYLASSSYTGANGCYKFLISNCVSEDCFNNAFLVIGGTDNSIVGCRSVNTANSAVVGWHTQGLNVSGNVFEKACQLQHNGIGNLGDSWGGIFLGGATGLVDTEGYMLCAVGNSILRTGAGRHTGSAGFYFETLDETLTSFRTVIDNNNTDATEKVYMEDSAIPFVDTHYPEFGPTIDANIVDIGVNSGNITTNTTNISSNDTDILANSGNITVNAAAIATKQATLTYSTVADDDSNPVQSKDIKSYVDANAGGSGASLGSNTFTGTQTVQPTSGAAVIELKADTGATSTLQLAANPYGGSSLWVGEDIFSMTGDRIEIQATSGVRIPRFSSAPTIGTNNSRFGCLYCDTSGGNSACKLYFHNGTAWKEVTIAS